MTEAARWFTRSDGAYVFARWRRPVVPVVFGAAEESLPVFKGAHQAVCHLAGHPIAETDPELGANLMTFLVRDWSELRGLPGLERLIPDLGALLTRLTEADANQYRVFRFDPDAEGGGIRAAFVLLRMDAHLSVAPAEALALSQAVQTILLWSDAAFADAPPLASGPEGFLLRPDVAAIIRAAYDPAMPVAATDPAHALRLAARIAPIQ